MTSRSVFRIVLCTGFVSAAHAGQRCRDSAGNSPCVGTNTPCVCVERADITPEQDTDFRFDFGESGYPDVTFLTGNLTWNVWSQVSASNSAPADLGDLRIDASVATHNFVVELRNPNNDNPAAVNMKSVVLKDATDWTGYSSIALGSRIEGSLEGDLEVVASGGSGGTGDLTVAGNILGNVTMAEIPNGAAFEIGQDLAVGSVLSVTTVLGTVEINGDLLGQVAVNHLQDGGLINVVKGVGEDATVDVFMHQGAAIYVNSDRFEEGPIAPFAGAMRLAGGVPQFAQVNVAGGMAATGTIDLDGGDVIGQLTIRGGSGIIYNGGVVTGYDPVFGLLGVFLGFEDDVF